MKTLDWSVETLDLDYNSLGLDYKKIKISDFFAHPGPIKNFIFFLPTPDPSKISDFLPNYY
jgi:hypothetical protein